MKNNLTKEQTIELFKNFHQQKANNVPLEKIKEREVLLKENFKLVTFIINKYFSNNPDKEELFGIGLIGLVRAVDNFDYTKNFTFSTYASKVIYNKILMYLRDLKNPKNIIPLDKPIKDVNNNTLLLSDMLPDPDSELFITNLINKEAVKEILKNYFTHLQPKEQICLILNFGLYGNNAQNQNQIKEFVTISQAQVSRIITKAIKNLNILLNPPEQCSSKEMIIKNELLKRQYPLIKSKNDYIDYLNSKRRSHGKEIIK